MFGALGKESFAWGDIWKITFLILALLLTQYFWDLFSSKSFQIEDNCMSEALELRFRFGIFLISEKRPKLSNNYSKESKNVGTDAKYLN